MSAPAIEQLKREYTDKYVAVDAARPELARFRGAVGQVKTVNMNGRALVQFLDYHLNTGWYDIDLGSLKVVDAPPKDAPAKPEAKPAKPAAKPPGEAASAAGPAAGEKKKLSPLEMARMQGAGGAAKAAPAKPAAPAKSETKAAAEKPAAPAKVDRGKMSVAEMLAAARANKPAAAAAAPEAAPTPAAKAPTPEPAPAPKAEAPAPTPEPAAAGEIKRVDKSTMTVADMIAYCRAKDAK